MFMFVIQKELPRVNNGFDRVIRSHDIVFAFGKSAGARARVILLAECALVKT